VSGEGGGGEISRYPESLKVNYLERGQMLDVDLGIHTFWSSVG
jgi:hypothetical protein